MAETISGTKSIQIPKQRRYIKGTILPAFTGCSFLNFETYSIDTQRASDKGSAGITTTQQPWNFKFLVPENFQESIQHSWADYSSWTSKFANWFIPTIQSVAGVYTSATNTLKDASMANNSMSATQLGTSAQTSEGAISMRFDAALTYQTSQRRRYMFELHFADCGDPYEDVVYPIKLLEWLSSASVNGGFAQITRPYIFRVYTNPVKFLYMKYCALESILPNFSAPYRNGYPTSASVQLSFVELAPLYKDQFKNELTGENSSTNAAAQDPNAEVIGPTG